MATRVGHSKQYRADGTHRPSTVRLRANTIRMFLAEIEELSNADPDGPTRQNTASLDVATNIIMNIRNRLRGPMYDNPGEQPRS